MIVCKPIHRENVKNIVINTEVKVIKQVQKIKALGMFFTSGLSNYANVQNIISKVNFRLTMLRGVFKFAEKKTRIILVKSLIVSIFRYCAPLLIDSNAIMINKLQTLLMKCAHAVLGFKSYKMTTIEIMREMKIITVHHLIIKESIQLVHKIIFNGGPNIIHRLFTFSRCNNNNIRGVRKPMMTKLHRSQKVCNSLFYRAIYLYNLCDNDLKFYNPKKLSRYLQKNMNNMFPNNKIPKVL